MQEFISLLLLYFIIRTGFAFTCFGQIDTSSTVCSGNGDCVQDDNCQCYTGFTGVKCEVSNYDLHSFFNIEASRLYCGGVEPNKRVFSDQSSHTFNLCGNGGELKPFPVLGDLQGKTIRDMCVNKYWGIAIDSSYDVYVWGDNSIHNHYLNQAGVQHPLKINLNGKKAKKVACTEANLFILFFDGSVQAMGEASNNLLSQDESLFVELYNSGVKNIVTSPFAIYVTLDQYDTNNKIVVKVGGKTTILNSFPYPNLDTTNFPKYLIPRIIPVDTGALFSFKGNIHLFSGHDHPSSLQSETIPKKISFSHLSQLSNTDPIDLITRRANGGCLTILSKNRLFVSGQNCDLYSLETPKIHPYEITSTQLNDFADLPNDQKEIFDMKCGKDTCFILTAQSIFAYGSGNQLNLLTAMTEGAFPTWTNKLTKFRNDMMSLIPSIGGVSGSNIFFSFKKPSSFLQISKTDVTKYPPKFNSFNSGLTRNQLKIMIQKKEIFNQLNPIISFLGSSSPSCNFLRNLPILSNTNNYYSIWKFWNSNDYDFYVTEKDWNFHKNNCGWKMEQKNNYTSYKNRILFSEFFLLDYQNSFMRERREDFALDVEINIDDTIDINHEIILDSQTLDKDIKVSILYTSFDRDNYIGKLFFQISNIRPFYVRANSITLGRIFNRFKFDSFSVHEILGNSGTNGGTTIGINNGGIGTDRVIQNFVLDFRLLDSICDPSAAFEIQGYQSCNSNGGNGINCPSTGDEFFSYAIFNVSIGNICAKLVSTTGLEGSIESYKDWMYLEESSIFETDKIGYFLITLSTPLNMTIAVSTIQDISFNDHSLFFGFTTTSKGLDSKLVIDHPVRTNQAGFHFTFLNQFANSISDGQTGIFNIFVKIKVTFAFDTVNGRRFLSKYVTRSIPIEGIPPNTDTKVLKAIQLKGKDNPINPILQFPWQMIVVSSVVSILVIVTIMVILCVLFTPFTCCYCCKRMKRKKKKNRNNGKNGKNGKIEKEEIIDVVNDDEITQEDTICKQPQHIETHFHFEKSQMSLKL